MTAIAISPSADAEPADGFVEATPVEPKASAPAPAKAAEAPKAEPAAADAAKPADGKLIAEKPATPDLKADGMHADDLKAFSSAFAKGPQAVLDAMLPALRARSEANLAAAQEDWRKENAKDPAHRERADAALSVVSEAARKALAETAFVDHPALAAVFKDFGDFVRKATKQDTAAPGASPSAASKFKPEDLSANAFADGLGGGF